MSYSHTVQTRQTTDSHRGLRLFGLAAVVVGLLLLAASAFVLSYAGIHAVALSASVSPKLARIYPVIFDAMLVVACSAVLSLRGAGVPSRLYAWLSMLALFAAAAGADTLHATGARLPHKQAAAAAAIIPWALVLVGFGLLLCMLRQARLRRAAAPARAAQKAFPERAGHVEVRASIHELIGAQTPPAGHGPVRAQPAGELAIETDTGRDDPARDEGLAWFPDAGGQRLAGSGRPPASTPAADRPAPSFRPAPTMPLDAPAAEPQSPPSPILNETADPQADSQHVADEVTEPEPAASPALDAAADPQADSQSAPETEAALRPVPPAEAEPQAEAEAQNEPEPGPDARDEADAAPESEPAPGPEIDPAPPATAQFDRMRSSPVPPDG
jgi:hypothetical protein